VFLMNLMNHDFVNFLTRGPAKCVQFKGFTHFKFQLSLIFDLIKKHGYVCLATFKFVDSFEISFVRNLVLPTFTAVTNLTY
jgi:hypothetical protein